MPPDSAWAKVFFVPVSCFLLFNIGDYIGRFLAGLVQWPRPGKVGSYVTLGLALLRSEIFSVWLDLIQYIVWNIFQLKNN